MDNPNFPYCNNCHNTFITPYHFQRHLSSCGRRNPQPVNMFSSIDKTQKSSKK